MGLLAKTTSFGALLLHASPFYALKKVQRLPFHNLFYKPIEDLITRMRPREDLITRMKDHEKLGSYSKLQTL